MLNLLIFTFNLFIYIMGVDGGGLSASTADSGCYCSIHFLIRNWWRVSLNCVLFFFKDYMIKSKSFMTSMHNFWKAMIIWVHIFEDLKSFFNKSKWFLHFLHGSGSTSFCFITRWARSNPRSLVAACLIQINLWNPLLPNLFPTLWFWSPMFCWFQHYQTPWNHLWISGIVLS